MPSPTPVAFFTPRVHPHLYEINCWAWLEELGRKYGRRVTLGEVPDEEWEELGRLGFDLIWLMGVWQRSPEGRRLMQTDPAGFPEFDNALPGWKTTQVVGSPYSIQDYQPDSRIGSWKQLDQFREKLHAQNMGLILDFVPNHTALDHRWVTQHPEYYIQGTEEDFHHAPADYYLIETSSGETVFIARGKDPYFPPWKDVAQLNYFHQPARAALVDVLREIGRHSDGVRCDMAMLVLNDVFSRTWGRHLTGVKPPAEEFWTTAVQAVPGFIWLAEVYWDMEQRLQDLGFSFTYDKRLYDRLRGAKAQEIRASLGAKLDYQNRLARFLENHDEPRAATVFADRPVAAGTLVATLPGMRFYHHGQLEGRKIHLPIPLSVAAEEAPDPALSAFYAKILRISDAEVFHAGVWKLLEVTSAGDGSFENVIAYEWQLEKAWKVVVVNIASGASQARVHFGGEVFSASTCMFADELNEAHYSRSGDEIARMGLYVRLEAFQAHVFDVVPA
jgi:hypothetical protein